MLNQLRFLKYFCLVVVLLGVPYSLWLAATGKLIFAAILAVIDIVAFVGFVISRRTIIFNKQMSYREVDDNIKPV